MQKLERGLSATIDPLAWDALADLCEERGDVAGADLWRRRAGCLRGVLALCAVAEYGPGPAVWAYDLTPGWHVEAFCTRREVRATLLQYAAGSTPPRVSGRYHLPRASLLGQTQRSPQLSARYLRRKAFEWSEMIAPYCRPSPC